MDDADPHLWFRDEINPNFVQLHRLKGSVYSGKTSFQSAEVIDTESFGKCLVLDNKLQSAEGDEFIYHEALVHPGMIAHARPETVFIAGGGEGATLREALRYTSVRKAVMVDIDREAVDICRRFFPSMHQGAFDDSRTELLHMDARGYLASPGEKFDAIIIDLTDPIEEGPSYLLYTREFYRLVRERLSPDGVITVQSGSCCLGEARVFAAINNTLREVFPHVASYQAHIPSFGGLWGFTLASVQVDPLSLSVEEVDRRISARLAHSLRFYDGATHQGMFCLPLYLRQEMSQSTTIITDANPLFLH